MISGCYGQQESLPQDQVSLKALPLPVLGQPCLAGIPQYWTEQCSAWHCYWVWQCGLSPSLPVPVWTLFCHHGRQWHSSPCWQDTGHLLPRGTQLCGLGMGGSWWQQAGGAARSTGMVSQHPGTGTTAQEHHAQGCLLGALEGLGGKAGSKDLLHPSLSTGTALLHSISSPNPLPSM